MKKFYLLTVCILGFTMGQAYAESFFVSDLFYPEEDNLVEVSAVSESALPAIEENIEDSNMLDANVVTTEELVAETVTEEQMAEAPVEEEKQEMPRPPQVNVQDVTIKEMDEEETEELSPMDVSMVDATEEIAAELGASTHPQLDLTPDKSEMIKLGAEAASVIVGNPNHISVLLDTPDTIIVVPRAPGASHFTVIGEDGKVLMQRHVVVAAPKDKYVRIRRSCTAGDRNCQPTSVYYCPNMCHEVQDNSTQPR